MILPRAQRLALRLKRLWAHFRGKSGEIYVESRLDEYREIWRNAAAAIDATFTELSPELWEISKGGRSTRVLNHMVQLDDPVVLSVAGMKPYVKEVLAAGDIPVPEGETFTLEEIDKAYDFLARHPDGCVVKPAADTSAGRGITTHIKTKRRLRAAALLASLYGDMMIEEQVRGETCRALVLNGRMIHAVRRSGPRLPGDGRTTVRAIIQRHNGSHPGSAIPMDADCLLTLGYQNLTLDSIPDAGSQFVARSSTDTSRNGIEVRTVYNEDITDRVSESFRAIAERAAKLVGAKFVGIDIITPDITGEPGGTVLEVNTTPGLHHHYDINTEACPKPAIDVLCALLDLGAIAPDQVSSWVKER